MHIPILQDILILLGCSAIIVYVLQRLNVPYIIGFLLTGVIIGPYGFKFISAGEGVDVLSEIGIILLLFVIGMELSIKQLVSIKKTVFVGGAFQVGITAIVAGLAYYFLGNSWNESLFIGFLFSLSSTVVVLKTLQDRQQISAPHAKNALAILIFQDIIVFPMMMVTPFLAGEATDIGMSVLMLIGKSLIVLAVTYVCAKFIVPKLMHEVAKTNSRELFVLVTITICFAVAFLTSEAGLSLALGAFLAGLIISESEYSYQATSIILPFRELFTSFFFVSVGMMLDLSFFLNNITLILLLVLIVFVVKSVIAGAAVAILNYPSKTVLLTGLSLFQIGEFSFILSKVGLEYDILSAEANQYFLAVSIISMMLTPLVIIYSENIATQFNDITKRLGLRTMPLSEKAKEASSDDDLQDHLVIIGYGLNGKNLAKAAAECDIPYIVIEMDAQTVEKGKEDGIPIIFGDAAQERILKTVQVDKANAAVIAISDKYVTKAIIKGIRLHSESLFLVVRTRYVEDAAEMIDLGANEVIPEEFETSVQIFAHILQDFEVSDDKIDKIMEQIREETNDSYKANLKPPKIY